MMRTSLRDVYSGLFILGVGALILVYTLTHYRLGSLQNMDRGMFPVIAAVILLICGAFTTINGWRKGGGTIVIEQLDKVFYILASFAVFAVLIDSVGFLPSVFVAALISTRAGDLALVRAIAG